MLFRLVEYFRVFGIVLMQLMASFAGKFDSSFSPYSEFLAILANGEAFRYL